MKIPRKEAAQGKFNDNEDNFTHQTDLLFLPDDDRYRFALDVIDNSTRVVAKPTPDP